MGYKLFNDILVEKLIDLVTMRSFLYRSGYKIEYGMEHAMGTWCKGIENSPSLLMEREPERHFPHTWPFSPSSTQFTDLELN
jgi:hypothetical protein